ncbi:YslB family protein [Bacillus glycinifermentans]|uniref:YslB family protein n=1 Tax=Bacillus glycinifermentans TaxID=1664069 RepID=UPI002DB63984|nr:YslB family protein [Bacillus glycinifermentans]MEC0493461.1 YslB family protein [Bacillus glycinifermentans]MEC0541806.1 YslB family protein [Bacillus glycinifermentans]
MNKYEANLAQLKELEVSAYAYELIREVVLPDMLGQDYADMMYWAGKNLARKFPLESWEDIPAFFHDAGWGTLTMVHSKKQELEFELEGPLVSNRLKFQKEPCFQLEAGFIAEQIQQMNEHIAESYEQVKKRAGKVALTVKWDLKDPA